MIGESAFMLDENGRKMKEDSFGFFKYLKYSIFDWRKMFGCEPDWPGMKEIDDVREEVT